MLLSVYLPVCLMLGTILFVNLEVSPLILVLRYGVVQSLF